MRSSVRVFPGIDSRNLFLSNWRSACSGAADDVGCCSSCPCEVSCNHNNKGSREEQKKSLGKVQLIWYSRVEITPVQRFGRIRHRL